MRRSGHVEAGGAGASVAALAVLGALVLSGCDLGSDASGRPGGSPAPVAEQTAEPATPPPTRAPSPTAASPMGSGADGAGSEAELQVPEAGEPPSLEGLRSDDELTVARTMRRYTAWMSAHPNIDPDLWSNIVHPRLNEDYELLQELTAHYRDNELWWVGGETEVVDIEVLNDRAPNTRIVRIRYERDEPARLIDAAGNIHNEREPRRFWAEEVWSRESRSAPWLTTSIGEGGDLEQ